MWRVPAGRTSSRWCWSRTSSSSVSFSFSAERNHTTCSHPARVLYILQRLAVCLFCALDMQAGVVRHVGRREYASGGGGACWATWKEANGAWQVLERLEQRTSSCALATEKSGADTGQPYRPVSGRRDAGAVKGGACKQDSAK